MKSYQIDIYRDCKQSNCRFTLGKHGSRPLFAICLNPSTANKEKSDMTISKLKGFAERNGFDGFVMLNLYPQRTTFPTELHRNINPDIHSVNLNAIASLLESYNNINILAAWGEPIKKRPYLEQCLSDIHAILNSMNVNWWQIGTMTKTGHPRHPSRAKYELGLEELNVANYLSSFKV